jgi:hypothetical protein
MGEAAPGRMVEELAARPIAGPALAIFCAVTILVVGLYRLNDVNVGGWGGVVL